MQGSRAHSSNEYLSRASRQGVLMAKLQSGVLLLLAGLLIASCGLGGQESARPVQPVSSPTRSAAATPLPTERALDTDVPTRPPTVTAAPAMRPSATATAVPSPVPTVVPTAVPQPASEFDSPVVAEIVAQLRSLTIDAFFDQSYKQWLLRDPQAVTYLGLGEAFGVGNDRLTDLSDAYTRETQELESAILDLLRSYDRAQLTPEQQVTYDVYEWWLDDRVRGHTFMYHDFPLHQFLGSYDDELIRLFSEIHPLRSEQDVQDYIARLSQVDVQVDQLLEGLRIQRDLGHVPPRAILDMAVANLRRIASSPSRSTPFYAALSGKLQDLVGVSEPAKQELLAQAEAEIQGSVLPAFQSLARFAEDLRTVAPTPFGAWQYPDGEEYYAYRLRHETSTELTADEVHQLGLSEVARIQAEMGQVFVSLGYDPDQSLGQSMGRAIQEGGFVNIRMRDGQNTLIAAFEEILDEVDQRLDEVMDLRPQAGVEVVGDQGFTGGGYYVGPALDGSRPGAFHTGISGSSAPKFNMPTIAYHEAIPGHHFQIAIAQELNLPLLRNDLFFNGYAEGWALYAERLAWELGLYEADPYGNLGRLQLELLRAVRLVVDTGIHAKQWSRQQATDYMKEALGDPSGRWAHEVERYVVIPAQATGYKIGMLELLELRRRATEALGDEFDIKEFHTAVLGNGAMPLELLEAMVEAYIARELGSLDGLPAGDGVVRGWAVLAEKDTYDDVGMTNLPVDHIGLVQMRQVLEEAGWEAAGIREVREFDAALLQQNLDWLADQADNDDVVVLYIAAHGKYLGDVLNWTTTIPAEWQQIASDRRLLVIDACQAAKYTGAMAGDPNPYLSIAAVDRDEYAWSGLEEEGLPIIGGVFTHYFTAAFDQPAADGDGDGWVSAQEAALLAEIQQRAYMHDVVFAVDEFVAMYHKSGIYPDRDPQFPHVILEDSIGGPLYLDLAAYR